MPEGVRLAVDQLVEGVPLKLLFIAANLPEARTAERVLLQGRVDFVLDAGRFAFAKPFFQGWEYFGLFFYVSTAQYQRGRYLVESVGLEVEGGLG